MTELINLTNQRFGKLVVVNHNGGRYWSCRCDCGQQKSVRSDHLREGRVCSCGCAKVTHGKTGTKEWRAWMNMKDRCNNPHYHQYNYYGGRGIKICERWLNSFRNFLTDMGNAPSEKHSLDRMDNDGNYEPTNCRWATASEQLNNRICNIVVRGVTLMQYCRDNNLPYETIRHRIQYLDWPTDKALDTPIQK